MKIYGISKTFPKEEIYSLTNQTRSEDLHVRLLLISVKPGVKENMRNPLSPNSQILKMKPKKRKHGFNLHQPVKYINEEQFGILNSYYNQIIGMPVNMMIQ